VLRILLIFACIWLFLGLFGKQLLLLFNSGGARAGTSSSDKKRRSQKDARGKIIPDDMGDYVDYTEVKS
jgi:hypothetical protein